MYAIRQIVKSGAYEGTWYLTNDMTWSNDIARAYKMKSKEYADAMLNGIQAQYANKEMFVNEVVTIKKGEIV